MSASNKKEEWFMLWQQEKVAIEECLKNGFERYSKRFGHKPVKVYVNYKTTIKVFDGAILIPDNSMYSAGLIGMVV